MGVQSIGSELLDIRPSTIELEEQLAEVENSDYATNHRFARRASGIGPKAVGRILESFVSEDSLEQLLQPAVSEVVSLVARAYLQMFLPHGTFWHRFATKSPQEKSAIADYVSRRFLTNGFRGFVAASTTTCHLGLALSHNRSQGTLTYTNSLVFPMAAVRENGFHRVQVFGGPIYDGFCGGWLFPVDDRKSADRLRGLFRQTQDRLTTAILAPMAMKPTSGPLFVRPESANLARILVEEAEHILILVPANRIYSEDAELSTNIPWAPAWTTGFPLSKPVSLIVAGQPQSGSIFNLQSAFVEAGFEVHWQDPDTLQWPKEISGRERGIAKAAVATTSIDSAPLHATHYTQDELRSLAKHSPNAFLQRVFARSAYFAGADDGCRTKHDDVKELIHGILQINALLGVFRQHRKISGKGGGAAQALGLSRNALHYGLRQLRLSAKDFTRADANVASLVMKSDYLRPMVLDLESADKTVARAEHNEVSSFG